MNNRGLALYVQAIRGPVLLAGFGVLFALQQAHIRRFSHTWPLLLILFGVLKLLERMAGPAPALPPPPPFQPGPRAWPQAGPVYSQPVNRPPAAWSSTPAAAPSPAPWTTPPAAARPSAPAGPPVVATPPAPAAGAPQTPGSNRPAEAQTPAANPATPREQPPGEAQ